MQDGDDELHFLCHAFGELFDFFIPPFRDFKAFEPLTEGCFGFAFAESFETCEEKGLFTDFHFFIKSAFFGQVAYLGHIGCRKLVSVESHDTAVGGCDVVDDTDQSCLAGSVRAKQTVDTAAGHGNRYIVECAMFREVFCDVFCGKYIFHTQ